MVLKTLSPDQKHALSKVLVPWFNNPSSHAILTGGGGTGKTTVLKNLLDQLKLNINPDIVFIASSHAAIERGKQQLGSNLRTATIAHVLKTPIFAINVKKGSEEQTWSLKKTDSELSLAISEYLGTPMSFKRSGQDMIELSLALSKTLKQFVEIRFTTRFYQKFSPTIPSDVYTPLPKLIIVDEASMVSNEEAKALIKLGLPILFVGDINQLGPVGGTANSYFKDDATQYFAKLTTNHRSTKGIQNLSDWLITNKNNDTFSTGIIEDTSVRLISKLPQNLDSNTIITTFKNCDVKRFNQKYHALKSTIDFPEIGEPVMNLTNSSIISHGTKGILSKVFSFDELKEFSELIAVLLNQYKVKLVEITTDYGTHRLLVDTEDIIEHNRDINFRMNTTKGQNRIQQLNTLEKALNAAKVNIPELWSLDLTIHDITYAYAVTIHKVQGSEKDHVIFVTPDLPINAKRTLFNTAVTRAKSKLDILLLNQDY